EHGGDVVLALLPLETDREAVRLVADALDEEERLAVARQDDRERLPGQPHLFESLGDAGDRDVADAELAQHGGSGVDLRLAAVDEDEAGSVREALAAGALLLVGGGGLVLIEAGEPASQHLRDRLEVVGVLLDR